MLRYGFFDSEIEGYDDEGMPVFDRAESSDFLAMFISRIISDGVLAAPGTCFQVIAAEGMEVTVMPGFGIVRGRFAMDEQNATLTLENAPKAYKRIDRVVLRANYMERLCEIIVKTGTPAATPKAPELIRPAAGDYYELSLATITVNANQTFITQSSIRDTRYDSKVCGVVTQVIDHLDTSVFFAQLNKFYEEFVDKSNASYSEFSRMALEAYQKFNDDIMAYINSLKQDSADAYKNLTDYFNELSGQGQQKYKDLISYIAALQEKGDADLAEITQQLLDFRNVNEAEFTTWFERIKDIFATDPAGNQQIQIDSMLKRVEDVEEMLFTGNAVARLETDEGDHLTDDTGNTLLTGWRLCNCG